MSEQRSLEGDFWSVPFGRVGTEFKIRSEYRRLCDEYGTENVLVLTGSPTSMETFQELLEKIVPGAGVPQVSSLVVHATDIVNAVSEDAIISDRLRRELVHRFLADFDWKTEYLQEAAELESFAGDVARLMETTTWQNIEFDEPAELADIQSAIDGFHEWLAENDHIERGQLLSTALEHLNDPETRETVIDVDAVIAVEFEEFFPLDRRYLAALTTDLDLVCVSERNSSVRRTGIEPSPISDNVELGVEPTDRDATPDSRPEATAQYLATGMTPEDPEKGAVRILHAESADEQLDLVADEIERLRSAQDWGYDAFAVALKSGGSAVAETIDGLTQASIPTESTSITGFGDDPAIRELVAVTRHLKGDESDDTELQSRVDVDTDLVETIQAEESSLEDALRRWATESGLKDRIAKRETPLDARSQFGNVRRAFAMAEFLENTEFLDASWETFAAMLERAHEYAPTETQTSATDLDGGVRVDHQEALKNGRWKAVFVLNVIDSEYPGEPFLTRLFPQEWVREMPQFPGVTDVTAEQTASTFPTESTESSQPFQRYHTEHARRQLAVGANTATDRLYFCVFDHEETTLDDRVQPSRFLVDLYQELPWVKEEDDDTIWSERRAEEFALSRIDRALADVRRTQSQDVTIALDDIESDLAEIQQVLDASGERGESLQEAIRARVDFAQGRVRRD